jgi:hypothetical protein
MFPSTPEVIKAIEEARLSDAEMYRMVRALKAGKRAEKRRANGVWRFGSALKRIALTAVKR